MLKRSNAKKITLLNVDKICFCMIMTKNKA